MSLIILPNNDRGDRPAEARLQVEIDGAVSLVLVGLERSDGVEPDDLPEQSEQPQPYRQ